MDEDKNGAIEGSVKSHELELLMAELSALFSHNKFLPPFSATDVLKKIIWDGARLQIEETQDRVEALDSHSDKHIGFQKGFGPPFVGCTVHKISDALSLVEGAKMGISPPPVLLYEKFDPQAVRFAIELGITCFVVKNSEMSGHFAVHVEKFEKENKKISVLIAPDNEGDWEKIKKLPFGAPITVIPTGKGIGIYLRELDVIAGASYNYAKSIIQLCRLASKEVGKHFVRINSNVDASHQVKHAFEFESEGIVLVRSEVAAHKDNKSFYAVRSILLNATDISRSYIILKWQQQKQARKLFQAIQKNSEKFNRTNRFPVRLRLLDASPEDFLDRKDELGLFKQLIPAEKRRGVQMALARPELYPNQLDATFKAYRKHLNECAKRGVNSAVGLEVMVPSVRTEKELLAVMEMARIAAKQNGFDETDYKFCMMVETAEAAANMKTLAKHADAFSIGTNDLTSEVLKISRSDSRGLKEFRDKEPGNADPFVTLHPKVLAAIAKAVKDIREVNPNAEISVCGLHACDFDSVEKLSEIGVDKFSTPPNEKYHYALAADRGLCNFRKWVNKTLTL